jgi:putative ABC transport system ATP-binding protein
MAPVLELRDVRKSYTAPTGARVAVIDVPHFALEHGAHAALAGESGSGKTTLLSLIAGVLRADAGSIRICGQDMTALSEAQRDTMRGRHIGYVFQTFNLLQGYTALQNVLMAMHLSRGADRRQARALLERVGLADRADYRPRQLSVGQQQRVAVARALANRPDLVLADEPTGNLDRRRGDEALELIRAVCTENGAALLLVSHDPQVLGRFERVVQLNELNRAAAEHAAGEGRA